MDHATEVERLERLGQWLDSRFRIPGTGIRFGLDSLIGLIPGLGDVASAAPALYIIYRARRMGVSDTTLVKMVWNFGLDALLGSIPLVGDLFDVGYKANLRNIDLIRKHVEARSAKDALRPVRGERPIHAPPSVNG